MFLFKTQELKTRNVEDQVAVDALGLARGKWWIINYLVIVCPRSTSPENPGSFARVENGGQEFG